MAPVTPKEITVEIDTREQYPVLFPATVTILDPVTHKIHRVNVATRKVKLDAGDYRLMEYPEVCVVERKASQSELTKNLLSLDDAGRQQRAFQKLSDCCLYPVLLLELSPSEILEYKTNGSMAVNPELLVSRLIVEMYHFKLQTLWFPSGKTTTGRTKLGQLLVHMMLGYGLQHEMVRRFGRDKSEGIAEVRPLVPSTV